MPKEVTLLRIFVASPGDVQAERDVLRGGSFDNNPQNCRCAYRNDNNPDNRNNIVGFRVFLLTFFGIPGLPAGYALQDEEEKRRGLFLAAPWT